jgi:Protein of unknown function (DUF1214)
MGASEHPTAGLRIEVQHFGVESLHQRLDLGIVQLSHIEFSTVRTGSAPKENVRCRLHQTLPYHNALSLMAVRASPGVRLEHRPHRFFELQKQRIVAVRHHQGNPAPK